MLIGSDNRDVAFSSKVFYFLSDYVFNLCMNIPKDYVSDWCFCFVVFPPMCSTRDPISPLFDCVHLVQVCLVYYPCLVLYITCCLFLFPWSSFCVSCLPYVPCFFGWLKIVKMKLPCLYAPHFQTAAPWQNTRPPTMIEAEDQLRCLRQSSRPLERYEEEFLELSYWVSWHDAALGASFQMGLDEDTIRCDLLRFKVLLFITYSIIQDIIRSEM